MQLDCRVHVTFGDPLDPFGNVVDETGASLDPRGRVIDPRGYVCDRAGAPVIDPARDQLYTDRLAARLCEAYPQGLVLQSTHLAARAAWDGLRAQHPGLDTFRLLRLYPWQRTLPRPELERRIGELLDRLPPLRRDCPPDPPAILDEALRLFGNFHKIRALEPVPEGVQIGGAITWYYQNRIPDSLICRVPDERPAGPGAA
jgi:glycerol-3-phosphate O-acyltransferase